MCLFCTTAKVHSFSTSHVKIGLIEQKKITCLHDWMIVCFHEMFWDNSDISQGLCWYFQIPWGITCWLAIMTVQRDHTLYHLPNFNILIYWFSNTYNCGILFLVTSPLLLVPGLLFVATMLLFLSPVLQ